MQTDGSQDYRDASQDYMETFENQDFQGGYQDYQQGTQDFERGNLDYQTGIEDYLVGSQLYGGGRGDGHKEGKDNHGYDDYKYATAAQAEAAHQYYKQLNHQLYSLPHQARVDRSGLAESELPAQVIRLNS